MTHVFIVNEKTFKTHLEYMFAGTGASNASLDFIFKKDISQISVQDEKRTVAMITDVNRIRIGDKILFFVTGISKFYGVFKAKSSLFLERDKNNYLYESLDKVLTNRILIEPDEVYEQGLSEYDALDSLENIKFPDMICWSLIYRKLGGNRGCTMITEQESEILIDKIKHNNRLIVSKHYTYNADKRIITTDITEHEYKGNINYNPDKALLSNLMSKFNKGKAFEHYLQYFVVNSLKDKSAPFLNKALDVNWIGNEVMCSFGERRIDCIAFQKDDVNKIINIFLIELKDESINKDIEYQVKFYLRWVKEYMTPMYLRDGFEAKIHPIIISDICRKKSIKSKENHKQIEANIKSLDLTSFSTPVVSISSIQIYHFDIDFFSFKII